MISKVDKVVLWTKMVACMKEISRIILRMAWENGAAGIIPSHMLGNSEKMSSKEKVN